MNWEVILDRQNRQEWTIGIATLKILLFAKKFSRNIMYVRKDKTLSTWKVNFE